MSEDAAESNVVSIRKPIPREPVEVSRMEITTVLLAAFIATAKPAHRRRAMKHLDAGHRAFPENKNYAAALGIVERS
jgi:hypothetical protein